MPTCSLLCKTASLCSGTTLQWSTLTRTSFPRPCCARRKGENYGGVGRGREGGGRGKGEGRGVEGRGKGEGSGKGSGKGSWKEEGGSHGGGDV